eukprot:599300_1
MKNVIIMIFDVHCIFEIILAHIVINATIEKKQRQRTEEEIMRTRSHIEQTETEAFISTTIDHHEDSHDPGRESYESLDTHIWGFKSIANASCGILASVVLSLPAIAALIVAKEGDFTMCYEDDSTPYLIHLSVWLYVVGGIPIIIRSLYIIFNIIYCFNTNSDMNEMFLRRCFSGNINSIIRCNCCVFVFYLVWIAIGMYMYDNQMSPECKSSLVGQTIFIVSIAQVILYSCLCCCRYVFWSTFGNSAFV